MKRHRKTTLLAQATLLMATLLPLAAQAQPSSREDESRGKVILTAFGNFHTAFSSIEQSAPEAAFALDRAYLGYDYRLNDQWGARIVYDMGRGDDASLQRIGYVKNAYLNYRRGALSLQAGLIGTRAFALQEKAWGHRYVAKSFMDENKWASSADLGIVAEYRPADWLAADLSIFNGEGYKHLQADNQFLYGLGLTLTPLRSLQLRAYADIKTTALDSLDNQSTMALAFSYRSERFTLGAEYNRMVNHNHHAGHTLQGLSLYASGRFSAALTLYGRYDRGCSFDNEELWHYSQDGRTAIVGLQWKVNQLVSLSPNFSINYSDKTLATTYLATLSAKISL